MLDILQISKTFNPGTINEKKALNALSLNLKEGDFVTVIGGNGAGKSTLLKAITGIMVPTEGTIQVEGNVAALLELSSGFDGDLTVKENTFLRGAMLGYCLIGSLSAHNAPEIISINARTTAKRGRCMKNFENIL